MENEPFFSIIIPTRNRPELFKDALNSVLAQDFDSKEIIVINDGSNDQYTKQYQGIIEHQQGHIQWHSLIQREKGHGQSYSMNHGASLARGKYLCFLDDDDYWTDCSHLQQAYDTLSLISNPAELYYTNQEAFYASGKKKTQNIWLEDLMPKLSIKDSAQLVTTEFLLQSDGFAHLNCSIFKRDFYLSIGGMDENIRYECDRDIYLRSIDKANYIIYQPKFIAKHHIPNKNNQLNMSTQIDDYVKRLYQIGVYEKGIVNSHKNAIKKHCVKGKMYQMKFLAQSFYDENNVQSALLYAKQALSLNYSLKWHLFVIFLSINNLVKPLA